MTDVFFFQAEDGIRDLVRSRGLGDVYKRQLQPEPMKTIADPACGTGGFFLAAYDWLTENADLDLSLIHI